MKCAYGIDFGTTNSLLTGLSNEKSFAGGEGKKVFLDKDTARPHPSVVRYFDQIRKPEVGIKAKGQLYKSGEPGEGSFFKSIKRELGKNKEQTLNDGRKLKSTDIASEIFAHLKNEISKEGEGFQNEYPLNSAVVTIPVDFDGRGREEIAEAMRKAGIKPKAFVHEPFAALIGQFYDSEKKLSQLAGKRILVFDWGGGTLDLCLTEISKDGTKIYELGNDGISDRAGDDFDLRILRGVKAEFGDQHNLPNDFEIDPKNYLRFIEACEKTKIELSGKNSSDIILPNLYEDLNLGVTLNREKFEELIEDELKAAENCVLRLLKKTRTDPNQVDHVILAGGTSLIPSVSSRLEKYFGARVNLARDPLSVISEGAAIVAFEGWSLYNHADISVKLSDDTDFVVLPKGTKLDEKSSRTYTFSCVDSRSGEAHLFFQQRQVDGDNTFIPISQLTVPTSIEETRYEMLDRIQVTFSVSNEGILDCKASSSSTGEERTLRIHQLATGLKMDV